MCTTSAIYDHGRNNPPWHHQWPNQPFYPNQMPQTPLAPTQTDEQMKESIRRYIEFVEQAKKYDVSTKQPDCEDPKKAEFMKEVLDRLDAIEKRLSSAPAPAP